MKKRKVFIMISLACVIVFTFVKTEVSANTYAVATANNERNSITTYAAPTDDEINAIIAGLITPPQPSSPPTVQYTHTVTLDEDIVSEIESYGVIKFGDKVKIDSSDFVKIAEDIETLNDVVR